MATKSKSLLLTEKQTLARPDRKFWGIAATDGAKLSLLYSIGLYDLVSRRTVYVDGMDPANRGQPWFQFPTPPQSYEIAEPAATTITPTQDGGKFVESHGSIFKDIRIGGTVGLRPSPVSRQNLIPGAVTQATGITLSRPASLDIAQDLERAATGSGGVLGRFTGRDERGLSPKEATGFDDMMFLRNIFRAYFDFKRRNERANRIVMIWKYAKENELYIVEPINFTTNRDSSNPMSYQYAITLRALYKFDSKLTVPRDDVSVIRSVMGGVQFVKQAIRDVGVALQQLSSAVDFVTQLPFRVADTIVSDALSVVSALANIATIGERLETVHDQFLARMDQRAAEFARLGSVIVNGSTQGDKRVFGAGYADAISGVPDLPEIAEEAALPTLRNSAIRAARRLGRTARSVRQQDFLFKQSVQVDVRKFAKAYRDSGFAPLNTGNPLNPNSITMPSSVREETVHANETIRSLAQRILGNSAFWKLIAILNKLKPPYISTVSGDGVLTAGDKVLVPRIGGEGDVSNSDVEIKNSDPNMEALSPVVRTYGRDLRLNDNSSGTDLADLRVNQRGDLEVVDGLPNVYQALMIKFSTEEGELALHPWFGAAFPIGSKVKFSSVQDFAINTRATFLSDDRIEDVNLNFRVVGDLIYVSGKAKLKKTNNELAVTFAVRSY